MKPPRLRNRKGLPAEVCELDLRRWTGLAVPSRDLVPRLAFEGLSENEIGRARISMRARSDLLHARAGYRSARVDSACNARPVHAVGVTFVRSTRSRRSRHVRFAPIASEIRHPANRRGVPLAVIQLQCTPEPPTTSPGKNEPSRRIGSASCDRSLRIVSVSRAVFCMRSWR